ncbi:MAG: triose-phosphate isomerase [Actinobacteria bacterium]|nr:MAG: triose-phosphate isomerase [Actinomycetota bacterium]
MQTVQKLSYALTKDDYPHVDVSIHPPFTDIRSVQTVIDADNIPVLLGAQHCHWAEKGAFTGEVSPAMLAKLNVKYVIAGHSERRELFGELDPHVNLKVRSILKFGMIPILCVGETLDERETGTTEDKVTGQTVRCLADVAAADVARLVIAYEPIWAIGTGRNATPEDAQAVCEHIGGIVRARGGAETAAAVRIQYGGSVKSSNAAALMAMPDIDGALVGGASLDADEFARIVNFRLA